MYPRSEIRFSTTRREMLRRVGGGFGMVGLASLLNPAAKATALGQNPMAAKAPHFPLKAKNLIFLFLNGGLSQVDSFDRKPALDKFNGQPLPYPVPKTEFAPGNLMRSPFTWQRYGSNGLEVSEIFSKIGARIGDFCVVRSMQADILNHAPSLTLMNCGHALPGRPSLGSWLVYGLGTENQSLPGYVVLCPGTPVAGPPLWNSAFLPSIFQGTHIHNDEKDLTKIVRYLNDAGTTPEKQSERLKLLEELNKLQIDSGADGAMELDASIRSMEIAFRHADRGARGVRHRQ